MSLVSCSDLLEVPNSKNLVRRTDAFSSDLSALSAVIGIYHDLSQNSYANGDYKSMVALCALSADELDYIYNQPRDEDMADFDQNNLKSGNLNIKSIWQSSYRNIYNCNSVIETLGESADITDAVRRQLSAEALFIRAFNYFNLVNLFGEVPLVTAIAYEKNSYQQRRSVEDIYSSIVGDLKQAESILSNNYITGLNTPTNDRVRVNKMAVQALLARVSLFLTEWETSEFYATSIIESGLYSLPLDPNLVFLSDSPETIWQLMPIGAEHTTMQAFYFIVVDPAYSYFSLERGLVDSFESNDLRRSNWIGEFSLGGDSSIYFPYKYKARDYTDPRTEYSVIFRLAEQYLIRAECRARRGDLVGAVADLDSVRNRAGVALISEKNPNATAEELLDYILHERRLELFCEGGHRWLDLNRLDKLLPMLGPTKPFITNDDKLYPIPSSEFLLNPHLGLQNPGY